LPRARRFADDRATILDEIRSIIEQPDRRIKPVIYTMSSAGVPLEAWNYLRGGHIKPIERDGKVVAAKIPSMQASRESVLFIHNTRNQNLTLLATLFYML
jgi:hypothetical protein